ncbi:TMEM165/GDT1 family protein [Candidatus Solincola tengchongensis]|uniref:TMEM165/GDT1 family protein n=1 Tax=Candidatus Solincola tengchongensis TaxID=2900693 RepID=UPI00257AF60D|nr:TMEM165/GDT1 family protein [Candidatus Solincola tengchongensis]
MWWKALLTAFGLLFVAELGDKTQLAVIALAGRYEWKVVLAGASAAFTLLNALAVTVGTALYEFLPEKVVRYGVAGLFLLFGVLTLLRRDEEEEGRKAEGHKPFLSVFLIIALMELGDKTQLSLLALAARYSYPVFVFLGGTLALCLTSLVGALVGTSLSRLVSPPWMRRISGIVFLAFGAASLFW